MPTAAATVMRIHLMTQHPTDPNLPRRCGTQVHGVASGDRRASCQAPEALSSAEAWVRSRVLDGAMVSQDHAVWARVASGHDDGFPMTFQMCGLACSKLWRLSSSALLITRRISVCCGIARGL